MGNANGKRPRKPNPNRYKNGDSHANGVTTSYTTTNADFIIDNDRVLTIPRASLNNGNPMTISQTFNPTMIRNNNGMQPRQQLSGIHFNDAEKPNYIALFDYDKATKDDMTIKKNDPLFVIDKK
jgi:hypothetical protein